MNTDTTLLDSFLDQEIVKVSDVTARKELITLEEGEIDPRIKRLSYSSLCSLNSCPRKFQLYKLGTAEEELEDSSSSVTFAYGSVVGIGIQAILQNKSEKEVLLEMLLAWDIPLLSENTKQVKSFFEAMYAVETFKHMWEQEGFLQGWSLVAIDGIPAVEIPFSIELQDGFIYRGFLDAALINEDTGNVMVLELKTTSSSRVNEAMYKNSFQAIGYSIVLDSLVPGKSDFTVTYLPYKTKERTFEIMPFTKYHKDRAKWIRDLLFQVEIIKLFEQDAESGYPMHGESCYSFFRPCEYFNSCTFDTANITKKLSRADLNRLEVDDAKYTHKFSFHDLISTQFERQEDYNGQ